MASTTQAPHPPKKIPRDNIRDATSNWIEVLSEANKSLDLEEWLKESFLVDARESRAAGPVNGSQPVLWRNITVGTRVGKKNLKFNMDQL